MSIDEETLRWYAVDAPPDADQTVMVYAPEADEPVWLGFWDGEAWFAVGGEQYDSEVEIGAKVTAWAPLPAGATAAMDLTAPMERAKDA